MRIRDQSLRLIKNESIKRLMKITLEIGQLGYFSCSYNICSPLTRETEGYLIGDNGLKKCKHEQSL